MRRRTRFQRTNFARPRRLTFERMEPRLVLSGDLGNVLPSDLSLNLDLIDSDLALVREVFEGSQDRESSDGGTRLSIYEFAPDGDASQLRAANEAVRIEVEVTDTSGADVAKFDVGSEYLLNVYVRDMRSQFPRALNSGVFSAAVDVEFSNNIAPSGVINFGEGFQVYRRYGTLTDNGMQQVSAVVTDLQPPGQVEQLLFSTPFTIESESSATSVSVVPSRATNEALTVFGYDLAVPIENITSATANLPLSAPFSPAPLPAPIEAPADTSPLIVNQPIGPIPETSLVRFIRHDTTSLLESEPAGLPQVAIAIPTIRVFDSLRPSSKQTDGIPAAPDPALDMLRPPLKHQADAIAAAPDPAFDLLRPWFKWQTERMSEDRFKPQQPENSSPLDDDEEDGVIELQPPPLEKTAPSKMPGSGELLELRFEEAESEEESDEDSALSQLRDESAFLEGALIEPFLSLFRMQFRIYSQRPELGTDDGDLPATEAFDDGTIDLADLLRRSSPRRVESDVDVESVAETRWKPEQESVFDAAVLYSHPLRGSRGSGMVLDVDTAEPPQVAGQEIEGFD